MTKAPARDEVVSAGHETIGKIIETPRGFECWDGAGQYLFTEVTLAGARKAIFHRHRDQQEAVKA